MTSPGSFCTSCGAPRAEGRAFCTSCGTPLAPRAAPAGPAPGQPPPLPAARPPAPPAASMAPSVEAPPPGSWQVVVGDRLPTFAPRSGSGPAAAATPHGSAEPVSLRGPVVGLAILQVADLAAVLATRDPAAAGTAGLRAVLAALGLVAGLLAGRRRGVASVVVMLTTLGLALAQALSLGGMALEVLRSPGTLLRLLPNLAAQAMTLVSALRAALKGRR